MDKPFKMEKNTTPDTLPSGYHEVKCTKCGASWAISGDVPDNYVCPECEQAAAQADDGGEGKQLKQAAG